MPSSTRSGSTVQLSLDSLESRLTPAGNISVYMEGSTLFIQSDRDSNRYNVELHDDRFVVRTSGFSTINGVSGGFTTTAEFYGDQNSIQALMIDGNVSNDSITMYDMLTTERALNVRVQTGAAGDYFGLWSSGNGLLQGNIDVDLGGGQDRVSINGNSSLVSLGINLGAGNDTVSFLGTVGNLRYLDGAGGKDVLEIFDAVYQTYRTRITGFETINRV